MAVNLRAQALLVKQAVPLWRSQGDGRVINIASRAWVAGGAARETRKPRVNAGEALIPAVVSPPAWNQWIWSFALRVPPKEIGRRIQELPEDRDLIAYCT